VEIKDQGELFGTHNSTVFGNKVCDCFNKGGRRLVSSILRKTCGVIDRHGLPKKN